MIGLHPVSRTACGACSWTLTRGATRSGLVPSVFVEISPGQPEVKEMNDLPHITSNNMITSTTERAFSMMHALGPEYESSRDQSSGKWILSTEEAPTENFKNASPTFYCIGNRAIEEKHRKAHPGSPQVLLSP